MKTEYSIFYKDSNIVAYTSDDIIASNYYQYRKGVVKCRKILNKKQSSELVSNYNLLELVLKTGYTKYGKYEKGEVSLAFTREEILNIDHVLHNQFMIELPIIASKYPPELFMNKYVELLRFFHYTDYYYLYNISNIKNSTFDKIYEELKPDYITVGLMLYAKLFK